MSDNQAGLGAYEVTLVEGREWRDIIPRRRPMIQALPSVPPGASRAVQTRLFTEWGEGLEKFVECATFEMPKRPIPHAFRTSQTQALTELFKSWLPDILAFIIPQMSAPYQSYNPTSRIGWPYFDVPDKPTRRKIVADAANSLLSEGSKAFEEYSRGYIVQNVRLQVEPPDKVREWMFLAKDGVPYLCDYAPQDNALELSPDKGGGKIVPSRTRLVFLLSHWNLVRQMLDTAWHKVQLAYPAFKHNMYDPNYRTPPEYRYAFAFDVKHFERYNAACARARASAIGGLYAEMTDMFLDNQFLVPNDEWNGAAFLRVKREAGYSEQYTSGSSEVAPLQKDIFLALYSEFFVREFGLSRAEAMSLTVRGGDGRLFIKNYGDDNLVFAEQSPDIFERLMNFMSQYLTVEPETPVKFLGMLYDEVNRKFVLPTRSYALKTHVPERGVNTIFRKCPNLGWVLKRETYIKFGQPDIQHFFALEDKVLMQEAQVPWSEIVDAAVKERVAMNLLSRQLSTPTILDKDWLLSDKEKFDSGAYVGFAPSETRPVIEALLARKLIV